VASAALICFKAFLDKGAESRSRAMAKLMVAPGVRSALYSMNGTGEAEKP